MKNICRITAFALLCAFTTIAPANEPGAVGERITVPTEKDLNVNGRLEFVGGVAYSLSNANQTITFGFDKLQNSSSTHYSGTDPRQDDPFDHAAGAGPSVQLLDPRAVLAQPAPAALLLRGHFVHSALEHSAVNGDYYIYIASFEYEANPGCTPVAIAWMTSSGFRRRSASPTACSRKSMMWLPTTAAVEYFNAAFGHYFVTADPAGDRRASMPGPITFRVPTHRAAVEGVDVRDRVRYMPYSSRLPAHLARSRRTSIRRS